MSEPFSTRPVPAAFSTPAIHTMLEAPGVSNPGFVIRFGAALAVEGSERPPASRILHAATRVCERDTSASVSNRTLGFLPSAPWEKGEDGSVRPSFRIHDPIGWAPPPNLRI